MLFLYFIFILAILILVECQVEANNDNRSKAKVNGLQGKRKGKRQSGKRKNPKDFPRALQINYPLSHFRDDYKKDWRKPGEYNGQFAKDHMEKRRWVSYARAQDQEDVWLWERYFYGIKDGVVMESGALDGDLFSNSVLFEKFANWTTINVEADPTNYGNLILNRPNAINVNGALCSEPRLLHYSSYGVIPVRGFIEFMSESFIKKWHGPIYNKKVSIDELPTVQCLPVKQLFRHLHVKHIDLWILDVEGAEESVLKGVDFNEVTINFVAMECDEHDIEKNSRKTSILEANGFKCDLIDRNCMCKNNSFKHSEMPADKTQLSKWNGVKYVKAQKKK